MRLLRSRAAEIIGLALHELADNSLRRGARSVSAGRVAAEWDYDDANFRTAWREGGPTVSEPRRKGFGTTLIETIRRRSLAAALDALADPPQRAV